MGGCLFCRIVCCVVSHKYENINEVIKSGNKQNMSRVARRLVSLDSRRSSSCLNTTIRAFSDKKDSDVLDASKVFIFFSFVPFSLSNTSAFQRTIFDLMHFVVVVVVVVVYSFVLIGAIWNSTRSCDDQG